VSGAALRDEGVHQLDLASLWDDWPAKADKAIRHLARMGRPSDADDVRTLVGDPGRANQIGARFLAAARAGLIERVDVRQSDRPGRHRGLVSVWRGAVP
jgi:hypothetical protein